MNNEDEIVFLFKILLIGFDDALNNTWEELKVNLIPESENILEGVKFGVKNYVIPVNNKKFTTKIFYCSFNPLNINPDLRKSYYRGTNGVLISLQNENNIQNLKECIFSILEVNKDVLPVVNMVFTGEEEIFKKLDRLIRDKIIETGERLLLTDMEHKTGYIGSNVSQSNRKSQESLITSQISKLIQRIS